MHGRKKESRTVDEEAKKQKEREKKTSAYLYAMEIIFEKRRKGELDNDMMKITGQVLSSNPDIGTLWNIRKERILQLKNSNPNEFISYVPTELQFTEFCLKSNPKSYGAWQHRAWLLKETNFDPEIVQNEFKLCSLYLKYDDRNFHTWDYRKYLRDNSDDESALEKELEFTTEKVSSNFSNYSSWHLRSKILPTVKKDYLLEELDLVKNAAFTDPNDQSVWHYHRWLLKSHLLSGIKDSESIIEEDYLPNKLYQLETKPKTKEYNDILVNEITWVEELLEMEPDNKWVIFTLLFLLRLSNFIGNKNKISELIKKLVQLDPQRLNYYKAFENRCLKEWKEN